MVDKASLHTRLPPEDVAENTTEVPSQKEVSPGETMGAGGTGFTVTTVGSEGRAQPGMATTKVPELETVMVCVVCPFDQTFPVATLDVSCTVCP